MDPTQPGRARLYLPSDTCARLKPWTWPHGSSSFQLANSFVNAVTGHTRRPSPYLRRERVRAHCNRRLVREMAGALASDGGHASQLGPGARRQAAREDKGTPSKDPAHWCSAGAPPRWALRVLRLPVSPSQLRCLPERAKRYRLMRASGNVHAPPPSSEPDCAAAPRFKHRDGCGGARG